MAKRRLRSDLIAAYLSQTSWQQKTVQQEAKSTDCSLINSDLTLVEKLFWMEEAAQKSGNSTFRSCQNSARVIADLMQHWQLVPLGARGGTR